MKYKIGKTKIIDPENNLDKLTPDSNLLQNWLLGADIYEQRKGVLPIIIDTTIKIFDNNVELFSCHLHTKSIMQFEFEEKPINDIIQMFEDTFKQEQAAWIEVSLGLPIAGHKMKKEEFSKEVRFNKAYQIIEAARKQNLLS